MADGENPMSTRTPPGKKPRSRRPRQKKSRFGIWTSIILVALVGAYLGVLEINRPHVNGKRLLVTEYLEAIEKGRVRTATILDEDSFFQGEYVGPDGVAAKYNTPVPKNLQSTILLDFLYPNRVPTTVDQQVGKRIAGLAAVLLPGLMLVVLVGYMILSYRKGTGLFSVRSGARRIAPDDSDVRFADVAGQDSAVAELREIKDFLANPSQFVDLGAQIPKGVLMYGPPGNGKTMLARALAGEAGASFYSISGSDFVEVYVGVGASRVRDLFGEARQNAPSIIFIDEIDAVGRSRARIGTSQNNSEQEQALNQILAEMDGFSTTDGIIVIGATNRPDILDPALLRPGRFDRTIGVEAPDEDSRLAILNMHARGKALAPTVDLTTIASRAHGLTGADLANLMNEGGLLAGRANKSAIDQSDLLEALKRTQEAPDRQRRLSLRTRSIGRRVPPEQRVMFADVAGQHEAVAELQEIREFLTDPERFTSVGANIPKGVLLFGPPGCGKTMLAKALACETNAAFLSVAASEFVEMWVGEGASRVRDLFAEARSMPPAILFIDELDAVGSSRAGGLASISPAGGEQERTLNQMLAEMDGFGESSGVIVLAATNRPDVLDPALLRPGRFDRSVALKLPDEKGRLAILNIHARDRVFGPDADLAEIANQAYGLTGADLANVINEAALLTGRENNDAISGTDLRQSLKRVMAAPEQQRRLSLRVRSVGRRHLSEEVVTFDDVAGVDNAVEELTDVKEFLTDPERFTDLGARVPRGILLSGPPGCGKTLLARALAGEANAAFLSAAAPEFVEVFVGEGAARARDLFADARAMAPSILFLDELDAIGAHRTTWGGGGGRERENTLNQILVELDGFEGRSAVIVVGATNRPDLLDAALVRPGRFDRQVTITLPDRRGRKAILELYVRKRALRLAPEIDLDAVAGLTAGMSGADLENVVNEAVLLTARNRLTVVTREMVEEGLDRAILGIGSRSTLMTDDDKRSIAYHEAGHALIACHLEHASMPHKVTIIPRGDTLGACTSLDEHDRVVVMGARMIDRMAVALGGWAAERLVFGDSSSGAYADLDRVGRIARAMVRDYGMSEVLGPIGYPDEWGHDGRPTRGFSEDSSKAIDDEVRRMVDDAAKRAQRVLTTRRAELDRIAEALIERETLNAEEISLLAGTVKAVGPRRAAGSTTAPSPPTRSSWSTRQ